METAPATTTGLPLSAILAIFFSFIIGIVFGGMALFVFRGFIMNRQLRIAQRKATKMLADSKLEAKDVLVEAKREADKTRNSAETELKERRSELAKQENRVIQKQRRWTASWKTLNSVNSL